MFTGIIESLGRIESVRSLGGDSRMTFIADDGYLDGVGLGDSVAVNGVCLTVAGHVAHGFVADLSKETLGATTASAWQSGDRINLEKALTPSKPLGGHLVSGHVDGVGFLVDRHEDARSWRMHFQCPPELSRYIARKGSITINGISLTVNDVEGDRFGVNIIPQTLEKTTLGGLGAGGKVNLEVDLIARYLERLIQGRGAGNE